MEITPWQPRDIFWETHTAKILGGEGQPKIRFHSRTPLELYTAIKHLEASRPWLLPICCKPGQRTTHDGIVAINHREAKHGILTRVIVGNICGMCHTNPQELYARHYVTKQCLGVYLSFVTDVHPSFVTDLPMHFDLVGIRMFRQGCHRQARGTTHRTTYETDPTFSNADATPVLISGCIQHPNIQPTNQKKAPIAQPC